VVDTGEKAIRGILEFHVCSPIDNIFIVYYTAYRFNKNGKNKEPTEHMYDLRELAAKRGFELVQEYRDCGVSGRRARRPGLDALIADARQKKFSVVLVAAFDRVARSVKHFLQVMDEFDSLGIMFISRSRECRYERCDGATLPNPYWVDCRTRI
jgi:DNA invertase Pin-like site-specific DNA recombinase